MTLNNKTKTYLVVGLSLVSMLAASSSLSAVFAQVTVPNAIFSVQEDEIPNDIAQQVSQMSQHSKDATFLNIEKRVHGFSGAYIDETGKLNIYTTDPSITSIDKSILVDFVEPYHLANGIVVKKSNHSWHKWMQLENILLNLFDNKDLGITTMNVDDKNQVYEIGFEKLDDSNTGIVTKFLTSHNIPLDMVKFVETGKIIPINDDSRSPGGLHNYSPFIVNPVAGGAEIGVPGAGGATEWNTYTPHCTAGFIIKKSTVIYGLTAGHCEALATWNNGKQQFTQPYSNSSQNVGHIYPLGRIIGNETSGSLKQSHSDTLLFGVGTQTGGFAKIYRYGMSQLTVTGKAYAQLVGDSVCTSGAGSNSVRCGTVTNVGITSPGGFVGSNRASFTAVGGDSGSPVWHDSGTGIIAYGTAFEIDATGTYYSSISGIEFDQGTLQFN